MYVYIPSINCETICWDRMICMTIKAKYLNGLKIDSGFQMQLPFPLSL